MSHIEKQKIFDEYARSQGYKDWEEIALSINLFEVLNKHIFSACDLVQKEQQKRIADKSLIFEIL